MCHSFRLLAVVFSLPITQHFHENATLIVLFVFSLFLFISDRCFSSFLYLYLYILTSH